MATTTGDRAPRTMTSAQLTEDHEKRIRQELIDAGITHFGLRKFAARHLYRIIHSYEHVKGIIYGRYGSGGLLTMSEGMLIATDRRVIFLDYKPGYENVEEFTYDVVSGAKRVKAGIFSTITLYTRISNYTIRFANSHCVERFMAYVEKRRLETEERQLLTPMASKGVPEWM